jgi:hypothetical protein
VQQLHRDQAFKLPIRVMQVGQGNFLRAFFDWQIDLLNERCGLDAGIVIVRPTTRSSAPLLDTQGGVYTQGCAVLMFPPCAAVATQPKLGKARRNFAPKLDSSSSKRGVRVFR